jgi:hypothetical protein
LAEIAKGNDLHVDVNRCITKRIEFIEKEKWVGECQWQVNNEYWQANC